MRRLLKIHENVRVLRYPDHFASRVYLWYVLFMNWPFFYKLFINEI
jgi:hypothetical protein